MPAHHPGCAARPWAVIFEPLRGEIWDHLPVHAACAAAALGLRSCIPSGLERDGSAIMQGGPCGVEAAGAVNAGAGMGGGGGKIEALHRRAIAEIRKHRAKKELMVEMGAATA